MLTDIDARYDGWKDQLLAEVRTSIPQLGQPEKSRFDQPILAGLLLDTARNRNQVDIRFSTEVFGISSHATHVEAVLVDKERKFMAFAK